MRNARRRFCQGLAAASLLPAAARAQRAQPITPKSIVLGQSAALSGPVAELGTQMSAGVQAYFKQVNLSGGVEGRPIALRVRDDEYDAVRAAQNTRDFLEKDEVFALIAYVGTPTSAAALPIFTKAGVPFFGALSGAEVLRNPFNRYVFNLRASFEDETERIVEQLASTGAKEIAMFYQYDAYGQAGLKTVEQALARRSMKLSARATAGRGAVDLAIAAASVISASKPDAVIMIAGYALVAGFVREMKRAGFAGPLYNLSLVGSRALAEALGEEGHGVAISQVVPDPWNSAAPIVREYQALLRASGTQQYCFAGLEGFLVAKAFTEGLRRTGRELTRERFIAALETMSDVDLGGFVVNFSPSNHNGSRFVDLTMISRGGRFIS